MHLLAISIILDLVLVLVLLRQLFHLLLLLQLVQQAVLLLGKTLKGSWFAIYHSVLISIDG